MGINRLISKLFDRSRGRICWSFGFSVSREIMSTIQRILEPRELLNYLCFISNQLQYGQAKWGLGRRGNLENGGDRKEVSMLDYNLFWRSLSIRKRYLPRIWNYNDAKNLSEQKKFFRLYCSFRAWLNWWRNFSWLCAETALIPFKCAKNINSLKGNKDFAKSSQLKLFWWLVPHHSRSIS